MMIQIILLILILLIPCSSDAAYKVYLKDGSVISGVNFYEKKDDAVTLYFNAGSMGVSEKDILKIEGSEISEIKVPSEETPEKPEQPESPDTSRGVPAQAASNKSAKLDALKAELDALNAEIKAAENDEARLVALINEKSGKKIGYKPYELTQIQKELEPLKKELSDVQQKKAELIQKKSFKEGEIRSLLEQ
jgi:chromosome segregation ATPase